MKFGMIAAGGRDVVAVVSPEEGRFWPVEEMLGQPVDDMVAFIEIYSDIAHRIICEGSGHDLKEARVLVPVMPSRNIMCVGKNYHEHAHEFTRSGFDSSASGTQDAVPTAPIIFTKAPQTLIADGAGILHPRGVSDCIDYEAELGVVIGRGGRGISRAEAMSHVFGCTIINDVTARDLQSRHKQWFLGKSLDSFCPMGPWLVTVDEVDIGDMDVKCWVNGELRQDGNTRDLIFDVPALIETISAGITLLPGDIIATGTMAGVGIGFDPPKYLTVGDEVTIEISGLGRLSNRMV